MSKIVGIGTIALLFLGVILVGSVILVFVLLHLRNKRIKQGDAQDGRRN